MTRLGRWDERYRTTGADLPFADTRPWHGAEMEGYFWRVTDVASRRVLVVLCGINRHPDGDWATVAVAADPGGFVRSAVLDGARSSSSSYEVSAGDGAFTADGSGVHVDLGEGARVDLTITHPVAWPHALGAGGLFSALPFLGQYWQPHVLGGTAAVRGDVDGEEWALTDADVYAEKNWGAGFPERWWWGQAQGFERRDVCVAFGGGVLTAGPVSMTVGGLVVRIGATVIRLAPPFARVRTETDGHRWEVEGRGRGYRVHLLGTADHDPHVLPVPLPAERRNVDTDFEHLTGRLTIEVSGRLDHRDVSDLAGLEVGYRPDTPAATGTTS